ncbi:MAG TPA: hypothetical protein VIL88_02570 [Devosia sp.]|uniref:hypothetical protein n=1 Tax=Devosia sp. TaxID=1871048 RepID=UPI002F9343B3
MWYDYRLRQILKELELNYFSIDPDGESGRGNAGYYWRIPGTNGWDGPEEDTLLCLRRARLALKSEFEFVGSTISKFNRDQPDELNRILISFGVKRFFRVIGAPFLLWRGKRPVLDPTLQPTGLYSVLIDSQSITEGLRTLRCAFPSMQSSRASFQSGVLLDVCRRNQLEFPGRQPKKLALFQTYRKTFSQQRTKTDTQQSHHFGRWNSFYRRPKADMVRHQASDSLGNRAFMASGCLTRSDRPKKVELVTFSRYGEWATCGLI